MAFTLVKIGISLNRFLITLLTAVFYYWDKLSRVLDFDELNPTFLSEDDIYFTFWCMVNKYGKLCDKEDLLC